MHRDARSAKGASDMKLRQALEDFKVDEISRPQVLDSDGPYRLYILQKQGLDTFTLLAYLSKKLNVPYKEFGIAGLKDRHAITSQNLSIPT